MNFTNVPVRNPHTNSSHFGPGSEHGKPFSHLGQVCEQARRPRGIADAPLSLQTTAHQQTALNDRHRERMLHVFGDPPTHRSCHATHNKDGGLMDSLSHHAKIGSKHMCDPRPDHAFAMHRSLSVPGAHPWESRRAQLRDPTPWHFNAAFTTSNDGIGKFYSSHMMADPILLSRTRYRWTDGKTRLM
uniref:Uncharacterized protein n=1 Tax=Zooxanthella nutricula TaxID=1333877 RepID=A0A6U9CCY3_9DINO|mmetsp:Transcript_26575/g.80030  ORF Transcript_26575/g.80030 Transcript_26575/m.80030 type:complete len:187 (+) Transcript_26575:132-692(+)